MTEGIRTDPLMLGPHPHRPARERARRRRSRSSSSRSCSGAPAGVAPAGPCTSRSSARRARFRRPAATPPSLVFVGAERLRPRRLRRQPDPEAPARRRGSRHPRPRGDHAPPRRPRLRAPRAGAGPDPDAPRGAPHRVVPRGARRAAPGVLGAFELLDRAGMFPRRVVGRAGAAGRAGGDHRVLQRSPPRRTCTGPCRTSPCASRRAGGTTVVYSSDTEPCDAVVELARGAATLVHEATFTAAESRRASARTPARPRPARSRRAPASGG